MEDELDKISSAVKLFSGAATANSNSKSNNSTNISNNNNNSTKKNKSKSKSKTKTKSKSLSLPSYSPSNSHSFSSSGSGSSSSASSLHNSNRNSNSDLDVIHNLECIDLRNEMQMGLFIMAMLQTYGIPDFVINCSMINESNVRISGNGNGNSNNNSGKTAAVTSTNASAARSSSSLNKLTYEEFVDIFDTNVLGYFHVLKYILPALMKRKSGVIVHLSEDLSNIPDMFASAYHTSNYAIEGMVESLVNDIIFANKLRKKDFLKDSNISVITLSHSDITKQLLYNNHNHNNNKNKNNSRRKKGGGYNRLEFDVDGENEDDSKENPERQKEINVSQWAAKTVPFIVSLDTDNNNPSSNNTTNSTSAKNKKTQVLQHQTRTRRRKRLQTVKNRTDSVSVLQLIDFNQMPTTT